MVAEGVDATKSVYALSRDIDIDMPITYQVHEVLTAGKNPEKALRDLMSRKLKQEYRL